MLIRNKVAIVVAGVALAIGSAYAVGTSDAVVSRVVRGELAKLLMAPVSFERASFSFLGGVTIRGVVVLDPAAPLDAPLVTADSAHLDYVLDVFGTGPHLTGIQVERPRVRLA